MTVTEQARERLRKLLRRGNDTAARGFRIEGYIGTCRGSSPVLKAAATPGARDLTVELEDLFVSVAPDCRDALEQAELDFEGGFLGRGLTLTWPHSDGCQCQCESSPG